MKRKQLVLISSVATVFLLIGASVAWWALQPSDRSPLPEDIRSQIQFSPLLIPTDSTTETKSYQYAVVEEGVRILTFIAVIDDIEVTFSEYAQPPSFNDIPEYKTKFLENVIRQTSSISASSGTIYLGIQERQENQQLAVMLENGLVVFMRPDGELNESQWRRVADQLELFRNLD